MRQRPHNRTFWKNHSCVGVRVRTSVWFPTNQCLESALRLTNQIVASTSMYSRIRCARKHFPYRSLRRVLPAGSASLPSRCPWFSPHTSVLLTVSTQHIFNQRLSFLSLGAQLVLETTRGYCRRLVFLGL